jgi:hypothetical protein
MGKKYELDDYQADRFKRNLKVRVLKVGKIISFDSVDDWRAAGSVHNVVVLKEGLSAGRNKEVLLDAVEVVWHRTPNIIIDDKNIYNPRYE